MASAEQIRERRQTAVTEALRQHCESLPAPERVEEFGGAFDRFGDAKIVLLGEATHGTSEFYRARAQSPAELIERHGFNIVAVEADWPDAARIDRLRPAPRRRAPMSEAFARFPTWMWRNVEVARFRRLAARAQRQAAREKQRVDSTASTSTAWAPRSRAVLDYLDRLDPEAARGARALRLPDALAGRSGALRPRRDAGRRDTCEQEAVARSCTTLLDHRLAYMARTTRLPRRRAERADGPRGRALLSHHVLRLERVLESARPPHVRDAAGPAVGSALAQRPWSGRTIPMSAMPPRPPWAGRANSTSANSAAPLTGEDAVLIGFGTDRGTVAAASDWGGPMEIKTVRPARRGQLRTCFPRSRASPRSLTDWRGTAHALREALRAPRLERAIGVIYRPETRAREPLFRSGAAEQFDAYVWFEETNAVAPLAIGQTQGVPETYPFGL